MFCVFYGINHVIIQSKTSWKWHKLENHAQQRSEDKTIQGNFVPNPKLILRMESTWRTKKTRKKIYLIHAPHVLTSCAPAHAKELWSMLATRWSRKNFFVLLFGHVPQTCLSEKIVYLNIVSPKIIHSEIWRFRGNGVRQEHQRGCFPPHSTFSRVCYYSFLFDNVFGYHKWWIIWQVY